MIEIIGKYCKVPYCTVCEWFAKNHDYFDDICPECGNDVEMTKGRIKIIRQDNARCRHEKKWDRGFFEEYVHEGDVLEFEVLS